jgi:PAS domain-containing protein
LQAENAERRRAEELLRESEQRFRPLIDRSSDAAIMFDQRKAILYASRPSERLPTLGDAKAAQ